jgi:predicted nucleotidyltransferase
MRTEIPRNLVDKDYLLVLERFVDSITKSQLKNIVSIFITGSFARGDANKGSDIDAWCIFNEIDSSVLHNVGDIVQDLPFRYEDLEVNTQCLTINEFRRGSFSSFLAIPIIKNEGILLYGEDLCNEEVSKHIIRETYEIILSEVLLSIRHYISVRESRDKLTHKKIKTYILKPFTFALRLERLHETGVYPLSNMQLLHASVDCGCDILMKWFIYKDEFNKSISENHNELLITLNDKIQGLLNRT